MATIMILFALILVSSDFSIALDSALPGETGCTSLACSTVWHERTNTMVQLVPKLGPPSPQLLSMDSFSHVNGANIRTCVYPECSSDPCQNGATCEDTLNGYSCSCQDWFGGSHCQSRNIYETTTCQHDDASLNCGPDHSIHIVDAAYGRASDAYVCSVNRTMPGDCFTGSVLAVKGTCEGESTCSFNINDGKFGEPCIDIPKYLIMGHQCLCRFHTIDNGVDLNYNWLFPVSRIENGKFEFLVRTTDMKGDAHVALADQSSLDGEFVVIVVSGWKSTAAGVLRNCVKQCTPVAKTPGTFCRSDAFTGFWITFADDLFKMGLADQTQPFIEWQNPNPFDVTHVGVFSGFGGAADWMFYSDCTP